MGTAQKWVADLPAKTGGLLKQWVDYIRKNGPDDEQGRRAWLKESHGLWGTTTAWWSADTRPEVTGLASRTTTPTPTSRRPRSMSRPCSPDPKPGLVPLYEKAAGNGQSTRRRRALLSLSNDRPFLPPARLRPGKGVHATRIDFGFALGDTPATGRLLDTGGFARKDRITHRIPLSHVDDIDDEVRHWLEAAYRRDEE